MSPFSARAILFDMDGLLVDSEPLWAAVETDFARERGGELTAEHTAACVGRGLVHTLVLMRETFGFPVDVVRDADDIVDRFIARAAELALKPGARELLDAAEGRVAVALGSSSARRLVLATLRSVGLAARFPVVVTGDDVERTKPAPDIFLRCARDLEVAAAHCVVLEDSVAGARAGRAAGMCVIAVPERGADVDALGGVADAVVGDLFEARRLIALGP